MLFKPLRFCCSLAFLPELKLYEVHLVKKKKNPKFTPTDSMNRAGQGFAASPKGCCAYLHFPLSQNNIKQPFLVWVYRKPHGVFGMPLKRVLCLWDAVGKLRFSRCPRPPFPLHLRQKFCREALLPYCTFKMTLS